MIQSKVSTLKLKEFAFYYPTSEGVFFYTEHSFRVFVPKKIILKVALGFPSKSFKY